jgi:hypothetical protein
MATLDLKITLPQFQKLGRDGAFVLDVTKSVIDKLKIEAKSVVRVRRICPIAGSPQEIMETRVAAIEAAYNSRMRKKAADVEKRKLTLQVNKNGTSTA